MKLKELKNNFHDWFFDNLLCTQWGANFIGWWDTRIVNHRSRKDLWGYEKEADDKVWLMRSYNFETKQPIHEVGRPACERILATYDDIPEEGYSDWECGYWNGVMATLRWVLGDDEKDNMDT